ncbi:hypothetical protein [Specibacter sp. NPDC078692]|uniref:hypothetical protein n=1 Tax=Specibacter sp. NPDC078692 TaxID=3155818 RepID=UPI0034432081
MATATMTGTLRDFSRGSMSGKQVRIGFFPSDVGTRGGYIFPTDPRWAIPDSSGLFSIDLEVTAGLVPQVWYNIKIEWLDTGGNYQSLDTPDWVLVVPSNGGTVSDNIAEVKPDRIITKGDPGDASEVTVAAAIEAAKKTIGLSDLLGADDPGALRIAPDEVNYAIALTDDAGYVAAGATADGDFNLESQLLVQGETGMAFRPADAPGWQHVFTDKEGYLALGITDSGTVVIPDGNFAGGVTSLQAANDALGYTRSSRLRVACVGDSLTRGFDNVSGNWTQGESWPGVLQTLVTSGVTVFNRAIAGWATDEIGILLGAIPLPLAVAGGSIPASGPVSVTTSASIGWVPGSARSLPGSLAGIPGTVDRTTGGAMTFTRTTAGSATAAPGIVALAPSWDVHQLDTLILFLGRNDVTYGITGGDGNVIDHVVNSTKKIVDHLSVDLKAVIVVGTITKTTETTGTGNYVLVTAINDQLKELYGPRFLDIRHYLVTQAIYDQGITPTTDDLAAMAGDTWPSSIAAPGDGGTHYNKATARLLAEKQFAPYLTTRGWV